MLKIVGEGSRMWRNVEDDWKGLDDAGECCLGNLRNPGRVEEQNH